MRIIGIDPGFAATGFGVIDVDESSHVYVDHGVLPATLEGTKGERLVQLRNAVREFAECARADCGVVEGGFVGKNAGSAMTLAEARAAALIGLVDAGLPVTEYPPATVKLCVLGFGRGAKLELAKAVQKHLNLEYVPSPADAADALAIALTHWMQMQAMGLWTPTRRNEASET